MFKKNKFWFANQWIPWDSVNKRFGGHVGGKQIHKRKKKPTNMIISLTRVQPTWPPWHNGANDPFRNQFHNLPWINKSSLHFFFVVVNIPNDIHFCIILYLLHGGPKTSRRFKRFRFSCFFPRVDDQQLQQIRTRKDTFVVLLGESSLAPKFN